MNVINSLGLAAVVVVWLALIQVFYHIERREFWRKIMAGLVGLSVRATRSESV